MSQTPAIEILDVPQPQSLVEALSGKRGFTHLGMQSSANTENQDSNRFSITTALPEFTIELYANASIEEFHAASRAIDGHLSNSAIKAPTPGPALPFAGGFIGFAAYELGFFCEPSLLNYARSLPGETLLLSASFFGWALIQDNETRTSHVAFHPRCSASTKHAVVRLLTQAPTRQTSNFFLIHPFRPLESKADYLGKLDRIKDYIRSGDCYQTNLAQCFEAPFEGNPWQAFKALSDSVPTPFSAYLDLGDQQILSLSPERFLKINNAHVETRPIKGTRPRGASPTEDRALQQELVDSEKDRAENLMIVDLLRNDLGRNCEVGSIKVTSLFRIETFKNVHHLVSTITGKLKADVTPFRALLNAHPGGSITGAPKIRAMSIIQELENHPRGPYCGSIFYLSCHGPMDSNIAIRTALSKEGKIRFWGGGGIVHDSEPQREYDETLTKVRPLMAILESMQRT